MNCPLDPEAKDSFWLALNPTEQEYLSDYESKCVGCVYQLNQSPAANQHMMSTPTHLHCLIHNCGLLYSTEFGRWLMPSELLVAQGFPTHPGSTPWAYNQARPVCSFNAQRSMAHGGPRKARHVAGQVGNSMHVNVVGVVLLWSLFCLERMDASPLIRALSIMRRVHKDTDTHDDEGDGGDHDTPCEAASTSMISASAAEKASVCTSLRPSPPTAVKAGPCQPRTKQEPL